jgi:2-octaprenyl-6-methoxyphenol hydroxylase
VAPDYDVLIVGGGPVGAATALALRGTNRRVGLIETRGLRTPSADPRPIALSHGSRLILERFEVWGALQPATPIERIHVSQRGGFGRVELGAREAGLPALGYVVDYGRLADALARALEAEGCCRLIRARVTALEAGADAAVAKLEDHGNGPERITARVVVSADGGALAVTPTRTRDYHQTVVASRVTCAMPHRNVAYERFTPQGPLALLPSGEDMALVWTTTPEHAQSLCELPEMAFLEQLQDAFGNRLGRFNRAGARFPYPVALKTADRIAESRIVALGNAAQTLHPVAGQGLNIGLRDAWELAGTVRDCALHEIGSPMQLGRYRSRRRLDRSGGIGFTDAMVRLFSNDIAPLRVARGLGLAALGIAAPAKDFVIRRMTFGTRG